MIEYHTAISIARIFLPKFQPKFSRKKAKRTSPPPGPAVPMSRKSGTKEPSFVPPGVLLVSPDDSALGQVICGHLQCDLVAGKNADEVLTKLAADMGKDNRSVLEFHLEHGVRELFGYDSFKFDNVCF